MSWIDDYPRLKKMSDKVLDEACEDGGNALADFVKQLFNDFRVEINERYTEWKNKKNKDTELPEKDPQEALAELQKEIDEFNTTLQLGRDAEQNSVHWAMWKLGYNKEQIEEVLALAKTQDERRPHEQTSQEKVKELTTQEGKELNNDEANIMN